MNFPATVKAQIAGELVRVDALVEFDFASGATRLWNGFGSLKTNDGKTWQGLGNMGRIDGLEQSINGVAPTQTFILSGVDPTFAAIAKGEPGEYYRRSVTVYLQFFSLPEQGQNWQPLDNPVAISLRQMERIKASRKQIDEGFEYTVSLTAETPFTTRRRPPFSYWTDRDQQLRFPGDRGLEEVAGIDGKEIVFPDY